ncbi:MAG: DegT/DnrJ/EryC1/StrS aminotransferase family protein [Planctomycetaceae bacterium]|nr:DegT/DnrJ/EryC1/StrS aminotransferase family protein [Planctomycetaceae bacterium]
MTSQQAESAILRLPSAELPTWPHYDDEQIAAVTDVLRSGKVNAWTGDHVRQFEEEFASFVGTRHAVAVANGTVALELALEALDIPQGTEVIVPCRTFLATASAVVARGCRPIFADVERSSGNVSVRTLAPLITERTSAIICVHLAGWPCEMDEIMSLAHQHGLKVIEDCAQAHGAEYHDQPVGSLGHAAAFSFCQDKIISTGGEGGILTTDDETVWKRAWSYKDHGKGYDTVFNTEHEGVFRWLHDSLGTNWRLTEMQAAIGRVQLERLPEWVETRQSHAATLTTLLSDHPTVRVAVPPSHVKHACYKFYAYLRPEFLRGEWTRDRVVRELQDSGIPAGCGSCAEIYLEQGIQQAGLAPSAPCEVSQELGETSLMFPVHPTLTTEHVIRMGQAVRGVLDGMLAETSNLKRAA